MKYSSLVKKLNEEAKNKEIGDEKLILELLADFETASVNLHRSKISEEKKIEKLQKFAKETYVEVQPSVHALFPERTDMLAVVLDKKNKDYGNSFDKLVDKYGDVAMSIRVSDKLNRLTNLISSEEKKQVNESLEDTMIDALGYLLLIVNYSA